MIFIPVGEIISRRYWFAPGCSVHEKLIRPIFLKIEPISGVKRIRTCFVFVKVGVFGNVASVVGEEVRVIVGVKDGIGVEGGVDKGSGERVSNSVEVFVGIG